MSVLGAASLYIIIIMYIVGGIAMVEEIKFRTREEEEYTIVEFKLPGPISPDALRKLDPPDVNPRKGVILSGRGPIWLYAYLVHHYHYVLWVATYDPRIGAVVVQSHSLLYSPGDIVDVKL